VSDTELLHKSKGEPVRRLEVFTGSGRRRAWSSEQKAQILPEFPWYQPRFDAPFERRRLRFLNGLFLAYAKVGGHPWMRGDDARELAIYMGDASVSFELDAIGRNNARHGGRNEVAPEARLYLSVSGQDLSGLTVRWEDTENCALEDQLTEVVVGMAIAGEHLHRRWVAKQVAWRQKQREEEEREARRRKAEAERRERERIAAAEQARRDALLADARGWRDADIIRRYAAAVQSSAAKQHAGLKAWMQWALPEADRLDPIMSGHSITAAIEADTNEADRESDGDAQPIL